VICPWFGTCTVALISSRLKRKRCALKENTLGKFYCFNAKIHKSIFFIKLTICYPGQAIRQLEAQALPHQSVSQSLPLEKFNSTWRKM